MNFLQSKLHTIVRSTLFRHCSVEPTMNVRSVPSFFQMYANRFLQDCRNISSLKQMHKKGARKRPVKTRRPLEGNPFLKAIVLRNVIKKPRKPNSANRKCVMVRLSNGKEKIAYVPGVGHNLQEHNVVLVRCGRVQDCTGIHLKCVRGKYDLPHVVKQST